MGVCPGSRHSRNGKLSSVQHPLESPDSWGASGEGRRGTRNLDCVLRPGASCTEATCLPAWLPVSLLFSLFSPLTPDLPARPG